MKIAINGFGRIGRLAFRLMNEQKNLEVVAINDLTNAKQLAYLLKYDTNHHNYKIDDISYEDNCLVVGNKKIQIFAEKDPFLLPWKDLEVDIVLECTGRFTAEKDARKHIDAGAKKVIISAPSTENIKTIVYNVNENIINGTEEIISAASCTTNCLAPVLKILDDNFQIEKGFMTTIHAYTNDQAILDVAHKKDIESRRGRAGAINIVPSSTGAATAIGQVIPSLKGKFEGNAMRVPVPTGSVIDLVVELKKIVTEEEINKVFIANQNETIKFTFDPLVSSDVIGSQYGAIVDGLLTKVQNVNNKQLVKLVAWYDNEMGYSSQLVRLVLYLASK